MRPRAQKLVVVTSWDDADPYTLKLLSLLEKYDLKATFFVPIIAVKKGYITRSQLKLLSNDHEVGSHSLSHIVLTNLDSTTLFKEVHESKVKLEQMVQKEISSFCYPYGFHNKKVVECVKKAGYQYAKTCVKYSLEWPRDLFRIKTTVQANNQHPFSIQTIRLVRLLGLRIFKGLKGLANWVKLAKIIFDLATMRGGIYHLWGHASEINKNND